MSIYLYLWLICKTNHKLAFWSSVRYNHGSSSGRGTANETSSCQHWNLYIKKSRNGDILGPVELIVWPEQGNQGDWREQDDQGEVFIIIFGMSKSSGFQKYSICWVFWHFVCVFVFVVVFVIVFVFVFVSSYDFWIAFIISFHHMYSYRGPWSLQAEIMVIFEVMTDTQTHTQTDTLQIHL